MTIKRISKPNNYYNYLDDNDKQQFNRQYNRMTLNGIARPRVEPSRGKLMILIIALVGLVLTSANVSAKEYYYTRTRSDPYHLRVSEELKNRYTDEVKYESKINGTRYEYYKSASSMNQDELIFETIDKIFRHRLSPFYVHHYDTEQDRKRSFDDKIVSNEACARDLMYLVDKLPKRNPRNLNRDSKFNYKDDDDHLSPELSAFFDSYARQESGLLMGNTFWVGSYDQCINRHIFELTSSYPPIESTSNRFAAGTSSNTDQQVVSFKGRYCVAALKSPSWESGVAAKKIYAKNYFKTQRQLDNYSKLFRIQLGVCLPSSCESSSIERHFDEIKLLATSMLEPHLSHYELFDLYCLPDESSPLRAWSGSALYFLVFFSVWMLLVALATLADLLDLVDTNEAACDPKQGVPRKRQSKLHMAITWFSLRANYRKLMMVTSEDEAEAKMARKTASLVKTPGNSSGDLKAESDRNAPKVSARKHEPAARQAIGTPTNAQGEIKVNLRFLNAFKVLIMFWIINGHIMLLMIQTAKNILNSDALLNGLMHFLIGATFGVDLFFTMTGFLTSYLIFNSGQAYRMRPSTWLYLSFHRYWRLAPLYLLTFWFSRSVMQLMGSGPLWDYGTSSITFRGLCNHESWWYPLTLTSNLHGLFEECMITSWYISCDMQFWLVSPIFIYLLAKKPIHGWILSIATIVMSSKVRFDSIMSDQSARYDELVQPRADIFMRVSHDLPALYTHPHYRISAYIVGLLAGHYVFMIKSGKWKSTISARVTSSSSERAQVGDLAAQVDAASGEKLTWTPASRTSSGDHKRALLANLGLFMFFTMSFVSYILSQYFPSSLLHQARTIAAAAYSIDHLVMSIGASLVIVAMCFGHWSKFVNLLSHPIWTRLSKMNYALLLLQCEAIYYQIFRYDQVPVAGTRELINILFNLLVTLYPAAFVVTLAFEFPLANIEKILV